MRRIARPVWLLGWVSLLTDAASEAIYPLLPFFLSHVLGGGAVALGIIEGVAEGTSSLLRVVSGRLSDRWRMRRPLVIAGYALSSLARPLVGLAGAWWHVLVIRFADRVGKGIRSAPRDALLGVLADPRDRGRVYGFHRAMDHAGAVVGPLFASAFLLVAPGQYRTLFLLAFVPGVLAVVLAWRVREAPPDAPPAESPAPADSAAASWRHLPRGFAAYLLVVTIFTLGNSTDAFLLLRLTEAAGGPALVPLLWSGLHVVKAGCSTAGGALSDRVGRRPVIAAAWVLYAVVYAGFATSERLLPLTAWFLVYGLFFALSEGTQKALVADLAPPHLHGTAFGLFHAATGLAALGASVLFGLVWHAFGAPAAFGLGSALALTAAVLLLAIVPPPSASAVATSPVQ